MINDVLNAIHHLLPDRLFILLPSHADPELVIYSDDYKAVVRADDGMPVFVVLHRRDGSLVTWGEGRNVLDAAEQAVNILDRNHQVTREKAA